jgi:drug/metabolite transporter (DMT)-like permease
MEIWFLLALGTAACIVLSDIAQKRALIAEHTLEMLAARGVFLVPLLIVMGFMIRTTVPADAFPLLYLVSVLTTIGIVFQVKGFRHLDLSVAAPLLNLNPLFLLLFGVLLLGEHPDAFQLAGVLLIVAGTYLLERDPVYHGILGPVKKLQHDKYGLSMVAAALLFSFVQVLDKHIIGGGVNPLAYLFWVWLFINLNLALIHLAMYQWRALGTDIVRDWRWLGLASAALLLQVSFYYAAVQQGPVTLIIPVTRVAALGLVVAGGNLFHEQNLHRRLIAAAIMVIGVFLILF